MPNWLEKFQDLFEELFSPSSFRIRKSMEAASKAAETKSRQLESSNLDKRKDDISRLRAALDEECKKADEVYAQFVKDAEKAASEFLYEVTRVTEDSVMVYSASQTVVISAANGGEIKRNLGFPPTKDCGTITAYMCDGRVWFLPNAFTSLKYSYSRIPVGILLTAFEVWPSRMEWGHIAFGTCEFNVPHGRVEEVYNAIIAAFKEKWPKE